MDFFDRQDKARHNTRMLVLYFITGVATLIATIYLAVVLLFTGVSMQHRARQAEGIEKPPSLWNPTLFLGVAAGTLAIVGMGSIFKTMELSQGGSAVAEMLGGRLVNSNTSDPDERKLLNVVEEMSLASGVPVPQVYVLEDENAINAFAAGHSTSDAAVTVTRGCMKLLSRDELQGVVGHEFSHILNGDMRLNLRLMGILFGILCLAVIGRILLYVRGGRRDRNALPLLGLVLLIVGWVGVFFGRLIQAAVSRQREFLADASSVQFTRNPAGIAGALKKIGGFEYGSRLRAGHADEVSHMFFGNGVAEPLFGALATHPPLDERIRAIDPSWDGKFTTVSPEAIKRPEPPPVAGRPQRMPMPFPFPFPGAPRPRSGLGGLAPPIIAAGAVLPNLGTPTTKHLRFAATVRDSFPAAVESAAHDPLGASALIYGLLLSSDAAVRSRQLQDLAANTSEAVRRETERLLPDVEAVATQAKLPLVDLALPALRHFSPAQYQQFNNAVQQLVQADGKLDLFEYVLQKIVLRHLDPQFKGARKPVIQYYSIRALAPDCGVLLSAMAHAGADDPARAQAAFAQGSRQLSSRSLIALEFVSKDRCDLQKVDAALNRLSQASPQIKKNVLDACAQTVAADGVVKEGEAELLRAIADTLDCPIPPFVLPEEKQEGPA